MSTLIYHSGALGDFVTVLPMIYLWRNRFPRERICLLTRKRHAELAIAARLADTWWDLDAAETASLFSHTPRKDVIQRLKLFSEAFLFAPQNSPVLSNLETAGVPRIHSQPPFPAIREHVVDYHLKLLPIEETLTNIQPPLRFLDQLHQHLSSKDGVIIHPGSGSKRKNWPWQNFLHLAEYLRSRRESFSWLLGPAEQAVRVPSGDVILRTDSLPELSRALCSARLFIGNDSGVSHLSAALGVSSIVLFGPSDPDVWAPRGNHVTVLRGSCKRAPCHPGKQPVACTGECMKEIDVESVIDLCISSAKT